MPKSTKTPISTGSKPYKRESHSPSQDIKPNPSISPSPKKNQNTVAGKRRPWTSDELLQLFEHVIKHGAAGKKVWESAVEGRTANQAYLAWQQTLAPFLRGAIETRRGK
ncbi:uncharacterized protein I303_100806 [Kwoniella dejecticola CBS 10117]|uniref:Myb-like domain-containing protein n=1 Tax=Kwoniella dejecticola CBS 10117 TaxID=1296121 RepID=A0A1A6AG29_9TREE|nr:uncharacterized protein I303_00808 [Kwoniella dejecticola CBS 10117]OBR88988.1 hypothetical protein I303_00808 [Kwoniella dejecticola CBS 10117]